MDNSELMVQIHEHRKRGHKNPSGGHLLEQQEFILGLWWLFIGRGMVREFHKA
jgi:hypothetical protein